MKKLTLMVLLSVALMASATASSITLTTLDSVTTGFAFFSPNAAHIARNSLGTFIAYEAAQNATYTAQEQRIVWYAGAPETAAKTVLYDATSISSPPCIAAASTGELWAAFADWTTNIVTVLKWSNVATSITPQTFTFSSNQGENGKWSCAWDEQRRAFFFIGTGFNLLRINEDGTLKFSETLITPSATFFPEYPNLAISPDGNMGLAWTTVDLTFTTAPQYRSIQFMHTRSGGDYWSTNANAPWIVTPTAPALGDENGPSLLINYHSEELTANTWLTSWLPDGNGSAHFGFMYVPNTGERALINPSRTTFSYYKYSTSSVLGGFAASQLRPFQGSGVIPHAATGSLIARRGSTLYLMVDQTSEIDIFASTDWGVTWNVAATATIPGTPGMVCPLSLGGDRGSFADPDIIGVVGIWKNTCPSWATAANAIGPTDIVFVRFMP